MELIEGLRQAYVGELRSRNHLDFDDMILLATQYLKQGMFKPEWKYILVDEFQDISVSRWNFLMELLKASGTSLTVVGMTGRLSMHLLVVSSNTRQDSKITLVIMP